MNYYIRTTLDRVLDNSYLQIPYKLIVDKDHKPVDSFIKALYEISKEDAVLLEDDLILCQNFKERIESVIAQYPNRIINFFWHPEFYMKTVEHPCIVYNQCTYYPKDVSKQLADIMVNVPRNEGEKVNMYSLIENVALKKLGIKVVQYRPCLVQHLDTNTLLFEETFCRRRSPYFIDYLDELGISYDEADKHRIELLRLMKKHFKELTQQKV